MTPDLFLVQALTLLRMGPQSSEVDCRSALSRAYYSLYHETRLHLEKKRVDLLVAGMAEFFRLRRLVGFDSKRALTDSVYRESWYRNTNFHQALGLGVGSTISDMGDDYKEFREGRNEADYNLSRTYGFSASKNSVDRISKLIEAVKKL